MWVTGRCAKLISSNAHCLVKELSKLGESACQKISRAELASIAPAYLVVDAEKLLVKTAAGVVKREQVLPRVATYEQARNKGLEIIGKVDPHAGNPHIGKMGVCKGKLDGREWYGDKVSIRLDYDPIKGPHINITDYRKGKGINGEVVAIPFKGTELMVKALLNHLNTPATLKAAEAIFEKIGDSKSCFIIREALLKAKKI